MKRNGVRFLSGILAAVLLLGTTTFCWLSLANGSRVDFPTSFGSAKPNYFESGDGSPGDPYLISSPVHLYNLAWLQYLGYFNKNSDLTNGRAQSYFKLKNDLVMTGVAIPPIGTAEYPFLGHFDGNGCVVSSLTVSNAFDDLKNVRPTAAVFDRESAGGKLQTAGSKAGSMTEVAIVGLFGVTGDYGALIENGTNPNYANVNCQQYTTDSTEEKKTLIPVPSDVTTISENDLYYAAMYVGNFYTDILHVRSVSQNTLIGLAAGYVKGSIENVGVYRADMMLSKDARALDGTVQGIVSKYTLVGDFDADTVGWSENPGTSGSSPGAGFGNSIDMRTINRRVSYIYGARADTYATSKYSSTGYKVNFDRKFKYSYPYWNENGTLNQYLETYFQSGNNITSVIPLNVNKTLMRLEDPEIPRDNGRMYTIQWYLDKEYEVTHDKNMGYFVGNDTGTSTSIRAIISPIASSGGGGIYLSFGGVSKGQRSVQYTTDLAKNFTMLMIDPTNGTEYKIKDSVNENGTEQDDIENLHPWPGKLHRYGEVRQNFDSMMLNSYLIHGLRFHNFSSYNTTTGEVDTVTETVKINGETKTGYELVKGALNFTVAETNDKKAKYITAICGSFAQYSTTSTDNETLFDLFSVIRDNNGKIQSIKRINNIYYNETTQKYEYDPSDTTGKTLAFSFDNMNNKFRRSAAYYVEIPVEAGDFLIAKSGTSSYAACLMYLDIGADAGSGGDNTQSKPYLMQSVDFINDSSADANGKIVVPLKEGSTTEHVYPAYADVGLELSAVTGDVIVTLMRQSGTETRLNSDGVLEINTVLYYSKTYGGASVTCITIGKLPTGTDRVVENTDLRPKEDEPAPTSDGG